MTKTTKKQSKALTKAHSARKPLSQGGQTLYNPTIAAKILKKLAQGKLVLAISRDRGMPSETTIRRWGDGRLGSEYEDISGGFVADYARAQNYGYEHYADEMRDIAKSGDKNTYHSKRLELDTMKWLLSKMKPDKYGDRLELAGDKDSPLTVVLARYGEIEGNSGGSE